jgi:rSAM/selenodomain-associated transferase 1
MTPDDGAPHASPLMPAMTQSGARSGVCAIAVMAKAPVVGRNKTRLHPALPPAAATQLHAAFLRDITATIRHAGESAPIEGFVAYAPAGSEALFDGCLAGGTQLQCADGATPAAPGVEGLGRCLLHAVRGLLARGYGMACLVNADSPTLPVSHLQQALDALARPGDRLVLGPAEDGGYYLIGLKQAHAAVFADIDWSSAAVVRQTLERAAGIGLPVTLLGTWYDVDSPASLQRLCQDLADPAIARRAAASAACLRALGLITEN